MQIKTVSAGNSTVDYLVFGEGEKCFVILPGISVHSVLNSAEAIAAAYESLTEEYTVYLFDRKQDLPEDTTVRSLAADTAEAMTAAGIEKADVFGASMGGMTALYLAIDYPEKVNHLILGSTLAKPNDTFCSVLEEWIRFVEQRDEEALLESFADRVYSAATLAQYREVLISSNRGITEEEYRRFLILAHACESFDCYEELSGISAPTLVIGSEGDRVVTPEGSRQIAEAIGCESYFYGEEYGHAVYDEATDYLQRCQAFLAE